MIQRRTRRKPLNPEASGSRQKNVWTSANLAKLHQAGELLHDLLGSTRLPLHLILKKLDLYITFTRENSYSTFKRYLKLTNDAPVAPFDQHAQTTSEMYQEIKAACLTRSAEAWEDEKAKWKNTILTIQKGGDGSAPPDTENEEVAEYMERVISQHEELVEGIRNGGPVDILSLVYSSHPGARTMSQFVTADPNLEDILDNVNGSVRDFVERVITVTDSFECGIKDPAEMTFENFQAIAIGQAGAKADKKASKIPAQSKTKRPDPDSLPLEKIEDYRGLVERYRKNRKDVPPSIAEDSQKRWDRAQCRVFLRGLYADAVGKRDAPTLIWNQNWTNALVAAKLTFYIPGEFNAIPGTGDWNPSNWKVPACKAFLKFLRDKDYVVRMEPWSEENRQLMQGDPRYKTIPIVVSSTPPKNTIKTVGDTLHQQMSDAGSAGPNVIGITDKPLEVARNRSELKKDLRASHKGDPVKDQERLNRFLESSKQK
ncbi:hypothetical protein NMY22_g5738 [Coprinellus aureogranulatus]|nr:hypothetical protein NMY22_g5738 [Coprinellus aureogranulatus]